MPPAADAATQLYDRYSAQLYGYCLHQLGSREEAEDAVQTTFMNAFRGLARGIVPDVEQAWLYKIAHNVCLSRRRSSWRRGRVEAPNNMEVLQEVVPAREKVADELIRLQDVLEDMPESQRRAILLREWQGLSYREIADELELSQAAVETLIFRARRALAAGLEDAPRVWGKRLRRGADVGGVLAFVKAMLGGGGAAAVKVAAVVALAGAAVATTAVEHARPGHRAHLQRVVPAVSPPAAARVGSVAGPTAPAPFARHRKRAPHGAAATKPVAQPAPSAKPPSGAIAEAPRVPQEAPTAPAPPATTPPPATHAPASPVVQEQPASPPSAPKGRGEHGRPAQSAPPAGPGNGNSHGGQDKGQSESTPPAPDSAAVTTPGNSGDHGHDAAPGQEDKADKGARGNGPGK